MQFCAKRKAKWHIAPAREVINCHCVLVPVVLLPGEAKGLPNPGQDAIMSVWDSAYDRRQIIRNDTLKNGLPFTGEPNGIADKVDDQGKVLQRRVYGADGRAQFDYDTSDHGMRRKHPTGAHKHTLNYKKKNPHGPPQKLTKEELTRNSNIIKEGVNYFDE